MGIPSSVRYVSRWVLGGSPATSGNSPSFPALGSPAGFGAVGTSNSDGKTPGKPWWNMNPNPDPNLACFCSYFVHIFVDSGPKDFFFKDVWRCYFVIFCILTYILRRVLGCNMNIGIDIRFLLMFFFFSPERWVKFPLSTLEVKHVVSLRKKRKNTCLLYLG